jgi:hypothetical protein
MSSRLVRVSNITPAYQVCVTPSILLGLKYRLEELGAEDTGCRIVSLVRLGFPLSFAHFSKAGIVVVENRVVQLGSLGFNSVLSSSTWYYHIEGICFVLDYHVPLESRLRCVTEVRYICTLCR